MTDFERIEIKRYNLNRIMNESGITNAELGKRVGKSGAYIGELRKGIRTIGKKPMGYLPAALGAPEKDFYRPIGKKDDADAQKTISIDQYNDLSNSNIQLTGMLAEARNKINSLENEKERLENEVSNQRVNIVGLLKEFAPPVGIKEKRGVMKRLRKLSLK